MLTLQGATPPEQPGAIQRAAGFARPYLFGAAAAVYLFAAGWTRARHRAAIVELCRHFGYLYNARKPRLLPVISEAVLAPERALLDIRELEAADGNVTEGELITICRMVQNTAPRSIFEFGTFDGRTTLNMAHNSPAGSRVYTLDLPREAIDAAPHIHAHELQFVDKAESGRRYRGTDAEEKITQLFGDSATFDFAPYGGQIDFVFVDASHTYEHVINDSLQGLRMLRGGRGTMVWHDYSRWDGVTSALNDLCRLHPSFSGLQWIRGTTLATLRL
ncbi:MAG: class I SAM-dependent methyltransferase [Gemmatimonadaceae bacterium]|nr:class I SAM-dependent methyltransferase [Gemmatimonadaceae bacterium]